jgi:hypothetical protein
MLDSRAWIVTCLIVAAVIGGYALWLHRTRAGYSARSLSASHHAPNPAAKRATKSLHVDGCQADFVVSPGELVEPRVTPGASVDQVRGIYGKESGHEEKGVLTWNQFAYTLVDGNFGSDVPENFVRISLAQGHVLETLDGVELGIDSFGTIFRKMRDKKVEVHERIDHADGHWTYVVSLYSACGHQFRSEYFRTIAGSPEIDRMMAPRASGAADHGDSPWRSDLFMNKMVSEYSMVPAEGHDESTFGSPAVHN